MVLQKQNILSVKESNDDRREKKAKAIITGGTMALILLAATLVTTTFLMSPVIEKLLGWSDLKSTNNNKSKIS